MTTNKFKMPTVKQFLGKKMLSDKSEPVWVYLEREMRQNANNNIKPYNEKVGEWLKFLRDLKYYLHREGVKKFKNLEKGVGPIWYNELSTFQQEAISNLKTCIHQDLIEDHPVRTMLCLKELGITASPTKKMLLDAMKASIEDPGLFIWNLYTFLYKQPPNILRPSYDLDSSILMSCLVYLDKDECIKTLDQLTKAPEKQPQPPKPKKKRRPKPKGPYSEYLQRAEVKPYISASCKVAEADRTVKEPDPVGYKFTVRSTESYERLRKDNTFLTKRIERNKKKKVVERVCNYKFWEPPSTLRNTDPKMRAFVEAMKMLKKKPSVKHRTPFNNYQMAIAGIGFCKGTPYFIINSVSILPTGYIPINGGQVLVNGKDYVTNIHGFWKFPMDSKEGCDDGCDCLARWGDVAMDYVKRSKCLCGHHYDFKNEGQHEEKYFYPATRHGPYWIDHAKVYQMDPTEDFIKTTVEEALRSVDVTPRVSRPTLEATGMKPEELLAAFLGDISDSPLIIPHLPQANQLNDIQEWVRHRVQGGEKDRKKLALKAERKWTQLNHMNFKSLAYRIPFTQKQLHHMNWSHRKLVQRLFKILLKDFETRSRLKQLEQTRLWWSSMNYENYPNKSFLDTFFTYMPARMQDIFVINPYNPRALPKYVGKTCPL